MPITLAMPSSEAPSGSLQGSTCLAGVCFFERPQGFTLSQIPKGPIMSRIDCVPADTPKANRQVDEQLVSLDRQLGLLEEMPGKMEDRFQDVLRAEDPTTTKGSDCPCDSPTRVALAERLVTAIQRMDSVFRRLGSICDRSEL